MNKKSLRTSEWHLVQWTRREWQIFSQTLRTTQRPSKGTCDTGTSSCRCRKPITTLIATVCIATQSLPDRRCEMPRWWWICWTGLFCEESQWKHWISVRLKLSKLQFILQNQQMAVLRSICQPLIFSMEHSYRSCMNLMDAERVIFFVNLSGLWLRPCPCVGISVAHGSSNDDNRRTFVCSVDSCKSMQVDILISVVSQCRIHWLLHADTRFNVLCETDGRGKDTLKHICWKSSNKFRHPPNSNQLELPTWQCENVRNSGDDPVPWQLAATPTSWFSLSSTEGTVPPRSFSRKFAWKNGRPL